MDVKKSLLKYGKKHICIDDLAGLFQIQKSDVSELYAFVGRLLDDHLLEPVKSSGLNGNIKYPLYKRYRVKVEMNPDSEALDLIGKLHPLLQRSGYLSTHTKEFNDFRDVVDRLNRYLFAGMPEEAVSRKERSYEIFGREKVLDDGGVKALLRNLMLTEAELKFYDTPEYCFHDYIPERKGCLTLLICENKDIWFNIRRCMFEDHFRSLFGVKIDGVVFGNGNKVAQKHGALVEYVTFMGRPEVRFLYWGDIDREGFDIFRRTRNVNASLDVSLFIPGYRKMIEKARGSELEDSPSSKKEGMVFDDLLGGFSDDEAAFLNEVFRSNKLIPQEIIPYTLLAEDVV